MSKDYQRCISELQVLSRGQLIQIKKIVQIIENANQWENIQSFLNKLKTLYHAMDKEGKKNIVRSLIDYLYLSLLQNGYKNKEISYISKVLEKNWAVIMEDKKEFSVKTSYINLIKDWDRLNAKISKIDISNSKNKHIIKEAFDFLRRFFIRSGAIIFDVGKIVKFSNLTKFVFSTIVGGAVLFGEEADNFPGLK